MPTLLLMRHAKSDWSNAHCADHDRPLNDRGKRDAPRMGRWLREQGLQPQRIITSSAKRARKTADRVLEGLQAAVPIEVREDLYHATVEHWLQVLGGLSADDECILCIGHNPGLEGVVDQLAGRYERLPTGAIAVFDVGSMGWSTMMEASPAASLRAMWRPKELPSSDGDAARKQ